MLKNYIKIAWRSIWKHKLFSSINIIGLAIGLSASFVIGAIIYYDLSFDKFHPDGDRIYRLTSEFTQPEGVFNNRGVPVPLGVTLKEGLAGVETTSTFFTSDMVKVNNDFSDAVFKNPEFIIYTDANYFQIFDYKWIAGDADQLSNPNQVVLTENRAKKYFPDLSMQEVIGKNLIYNDSIHVNVTGIVANFQQRSDLIFEEFISLETAKQTDSKQSVFNEEWDNTNSATQVFIKTNKNVDLTNLEKSLDVLSKEHENKEMVARGQLRKFRLQPLSDIHFNSNYGAFDFSEHQASKPVLKSLAFVALFLLLLASINFINLNTAQATQRAKEIGIRKTLGSSKKQLIFQFLGETFLLTLAAAVLSLFLSAWLLQLFSDYVPSGVNFELFKNPIFIAYIAVLLLIVALFSGFYPALVLSNFKPTAVLKNQVFQKNGKFSLRKYLTVFQFVIAQIFIIATILVGKQIHFLMHKDMGFKTEAIAFVRAPWHDNSMEKRLHLAEKIKALPQIEELSLAGQPPASFSMTGTHATYFAKDKEIHTNVELLFGDNNYLDLYGIQLLAGRKPLNDSITEYVINKTYLKQLGFENPEDVIGEMVKGYDKNIPIVGVMEDFNQRSLTSKIEPMAFVGNSDFSSIHFALPSQHPENWQEIIKQIEKSWKTIYPEDDFKVNFMDDMVKQFYEQEQKTAVLLNWATGLSILISCLGLLGLVIYTTERRTKEIGIRKVLGASILQLNILLSSEFLVLVGIAFVISVPISWWGLQQWLEFFAYKTELSWWVFIVSGLAMILIAILIMSIKTLSAANSNPVDSLKTE